MVKAGHIIRCAHPLAIGEIVTTWVADQNHEKHPDVTFLVVAEETRTAYLAQAQERCGEDYHPVTKALAALPESRFYRIVMD